MRTFNVYKHPTYGMEAVKVGFSWPAFFFGIIWMLVKKLWGLAGAWFAAYILLSLVTEVTDQSSGGSVLLIYLIIIAGDFTLWIVPGYKGNKWREENLAKRGYDQVSTVQAETPDAAVAQIAKQKPLMTPFRLRLGRQVVMLNHDTQLLFPHHLDHQRRHYDLSQPWAAVQRHPQNPNIWGLKNLSPVRWVMTAPNGAIRDVEPGRSVSLAAGVKINFGSVEGEIWI